mmetsp:Transcript_5721/g.8780  ORF Transcript_5721/g.8780 Transcript_5721/m.8780 type:complete len:298 (+) Transcript_5721:202-1095(+)
MTQKESLNSVEIAVLGIVRSFHDIKIPVYKGLKDWCTHFNTSLYVVTGESGNSIHNQLLPCGNQTFMLNENHLAEQREIKDKKLASFFSSRQNRVNRIAMIRDNLRSYFRSLQNTPDAIIVVDLDLLKIPSSASLSHAVHRILAGNSGVICANGIERFMGIFHIEYDVFAMGISVDPWKQRRLYKDIMATIPYLYRTPLESCFGGLAVYDPKLYLEKSCNYYSAERVDDKCEHQSLHECLREQYPTFDIGILGTLKTYREFDATILNAVLFLLGILLLLGVLCRRRKRMTNNRKRQE